MGDQAERCLVSPASMEKGEGGRGGLPLVSRGGLPLRPPSRGGQGNGEMRAGQMWRPPPVFILYFSMRRLGSPEGKALGSPGVRPFGERGEVWVCPPPVIIIL